MRKIHTRIIRFLTVPFVLFPAVALAAIPKVPVSSSTTIGQFYSGTLCVVMNWIFGFVLLFAVVAFLYGALLFFTAGGNETQVERARKMVLYSIVGVAVAVLSRTLVIIVASLVGVPNTNLITCA